MYHFIGLAPEEFICNNYYHIYKLIKTYSESIFFSYGDMSLRKPLCLGGYVDLEVVCVYYIKHMF